MLATQQLESSGKGVFVDIFSMKQLCLTHVLEKFTEEEACTAAGILGLLGFKDQGQDFAARVSGLGLSTLSPKA